jgi:hypothetical protein
MNHEEEFIKSFIRPIKRQRYLDFISSPKYRDKLIRELYDHILDRRFMLSIPPNQQHPKELAQILTQRGAHPLCWVISQNRKFDEKQMPLLEALRDVCGDDYTTFLFCVPGRLGYFEGDGMGYRWILERRLPRRTEN